MTRETYQQSLEGLRRDVVDLGELVVDQLDEGLECLATGDEERARGVVDRDRQVNERYLELEDACIDLFALQQPVAGDLRFVSASFKILTDLERVGDLATNLGEYALAESDDRTMDAEVEAIGDDAKDLLERSLEAYATDDAAACWDIAAADDQIDAHCTQASERVVRDLIEHEDEDPWAVERLLDDVSRVLLTVRDLERVADHAVNVAGRTLYMVENDPALIY